MTHTRFVICGIQRTGTILLTGLLDDHEDVLCMGELFQRKSGTVEPAVPRFKLHLEQSRSRRVAQIVAPRRGVRDYLDGVFARFEKYDAVGFKLMVDQAHRHPEVEDYLKAEGFKVIHLVRENVLKTHISRLKARQSGIYVSDKEVGLGGLQVSADTLRWQLAQVEAENTALDNLVTSLGLEQISLTYEQLTGAQRDGQMTKILSFLGVDASIQPRPKSVKLTPDDLSQALANYDEVESALSGTRFAYYLDHGSGT